MLEALQAYVGKLVEFARVYQAWAAPIAFVLAFSESLAVLSLLIPAWAALIAIGALIEAGHLNFWPIWIAAATGAALGDWLSYWLGINIGRPIAQLWPLSRHPELLLKGEAFVRRWGAVAIVIGRYFGPLRASVSLSAGIFRMPYWQFQIANFISAFVWAGVLLTVGDVLTAVLRRIWE
jgi:membrane protein DedA with SNARE-associated domain